MIALPEQPCATHWHSHKTHKRTMASRLCRGGSRGAFLPMPSWLGCQNTALAPPPPPCSWGAGGLALAAQNAAGKPEEGGTGTWRGAALGGCMARAACMGSSLAGSPRVPTAARG